MRITRIICDAVCDRDQTFYASGGHSAARVPQVAQCAHRCGTVGEKSCGTRTKTTNAFWHIDFFRSKFKPVSRV